MSIDDIDKFEQNEMKKIRPIKNTWYDWLISYIPELIRKSVAGFKDKIVNLFEANTPKQTVCERRKKLRKRETENISNRFILKKKKRNYLKKDIFRVNNFWNMKVMVAKVETYHQMNILMKLNLIWGI